MSVTQGGADKCTGGTASAGNYYTGYPASSAFDDTTSTFWNSLDGSLPNYVEYDFGSGVSWAIAQYSIRARTDTASHSPKDFQFQYSDDGTNWTTVNSQSNVTWSNGLTRTYNFYMLDAEAGSLALTGNAAGVLKTSAVLTEAGSFALTGNAATLTVGGSALSAEAGSFTLTGNDAGLLETHALAIEAGSFSLTGIDAGLLETHALAATVGSFTLTGVDAGLTPSARLSPEVGAFDLTGVAADFTKNQAIAPEAGAFDLTGVDAGLLAAHTLALDAESFTLTGVDAGLLVTTAMSCSAGSFDLTGIDAGLLASHAASATVGEFVLTGIDASVHGVSSHRYWRVYATGNNGGTAYAIAECEMAESISGANVCTGGTPSASSQYSATYQASKAFDGDSATFWNSANATPPQWLAYDLGSGNDKAVVEVRITARNDSFGITQSVRAFELQYSDNGTDWTTSFSRVFDINWTAGETRAFSSSTPTQSVWRIYITAIQSGVPGIAEMQMRLSSGGADECTGGNARASSEYSSSYTAAKAFDDSAATFWDAASAVPGWLVYKFASAKNIVEYTIQAPPGANATNAPKTWTFQYWSGETNAWVTADTQTTVANWSAGETRTYGIAATYSLACSAGSFALTGVSVDLAKRVIMPASRGICFLTLKDAFLLLKGLPSNGEGAGGRGGHMLRGLPKSPNIQHAEWQRWFDNLRRSINPAVNDASRPVITIGETKYMHGTTIPATTVGAEAGGTATSGGYGFASQAEFEAHMAQVEAMRQALIALGVGVL